MSEFQAVFCNNYSNYSKPWKTVIYHWFTKILHDLLWKVGGTNRGRKSPQAIAQAIT